MSPLQKALATVWILIPVGFLLSIPFLSADQMHFIVMRLMMPFVGLTMVGAAGYVLREIWR